MSKRNRREHGRIISVETLTRGDALAADVAAGATSITVNDAGDFDEDGGWLYIGAQTVEYTACDDDTGIITLAAALTAAGEQGDPVQVWSDLYDEVVDYQLALVELDGEYDNPDPVVAEVAEGVGDLPEGDRGKAGESCTLLRVADDEWEVVGVGGRPRRAQGIRFEQDDTYTLTSADITAGTATFPLSHRPADEALVLWWRTTPQEPTEYTINYDAQTITYPLSGFEAAGDRLWAHYAYYQGIATAVATDPTPAAATLVLSVARRDSGGSSTVDITGVQVGDLILAAAFDSGGSASLSAPGGAFTTLASGLGTHTSLGTQQISGVLGVRTANATDVGSHQVTMSGLGVVALAVLVLRSAAVPTTAAVQQCELASPTVTTIPVPSSGSATGTRFAFAGIAGGSGQIAGLTPVAGLTLVSKADTSPTASCIAASQTVTGSAPAIDPAFNVTYNGGREGDGWPWVSFSVVVQGA